MRFCESTARPSGAKPSPSEIRSVVDSNEFCWYLPVSSGGTGGVHATGKIGTGQNARYAMAMAIKATKASTNRRRFVIGGLKKLSLAAGHFHATLQLYVEFPNAGLVHRFN